MNNIKIILEHPVTSRINEAKYIGFMTVTITIEDRYMLMTTE